MKTHVISLLTIAGGCSAALGQTTYNLADASPTGDVEYSTTGKVNWKALSSTGPWGASGPWASALPCLFNGFTPTIQPYGDVLAYTGAGVGDVDGDGYGDFAITWYNAEVSASRDEACSAEPDPATFPGTGEFVGFVRVISGNPSYTNSSGGSCVDNGGPTWNVAGGVANQDIRRIGPDFWGEKTHALWSHEISSIGDIDGDGKDEVLLAANVAGTGGVAEIWSCTGRYRVDGLTTPQWVKLIEITGELSSGAHEELGYQAYHGPLPDDYSPGGGVSSGYDLDFNNDGAPDLLIGSKWFRDSALGHAVDPTTFRSRTPGAVWMFMMPKSDVFNEIHSKRQFHCDNETNWDDTVGSDGITDELPLRITSEEFNARITGHQIAELVGGMQQTGATSCTPRDFGTDLDPAGDIDGDGLLDLVVGASGHVTNADYANDPSQCSVDPRVGQVYFFLSDSANSLRPQDGGETITFADLHPKFYVHPKLLSFQTSCTSPMGYGTSLIKRSTAWMVSRQIDFTSEAADFYISGHSTNPNRLGIGNNIEGGVKLDGNDDPDFAFWHHGDVEVLVMLDMQSRITGWINDINGGNGSKPTGSVQIWGTDTSVSYPAFADPDVGFKRNGGVRAAHYVNWSSAFGGPTGFRIAGNFDGANGDCELALTCTDSGPNLMRVAEVSAGTGSSIIADIWPDPTGIDYSGTSSTSVLFNTIHISEGRYTAWPIWPSSVPGAADDGRHDLLIGARGYPVQIDTVPGEGPISPWPVGCGLTEQEYNRLTTVPAGRSWVVRSKQ